jgi:hypothetical protein
LNRTCAQQITWRGRIVFRQGVSAAGRAFIECEDNGIGMAHTHLSECFACAGQRFAEMSEFLDEQADWLTLSPPIRVVPNSQFGIGVFSYFMLGSELSIRTRRFEKSGSLGTPLEARVSSASGLFRVQNGRDAGGGGSIVRIYLAGRANNETISCRSTLETLLFVADFDTVVEEDEELTEWGAGNLNHRKLRRVQLRRGTLADSLALALRPAPTLPVPSADGRLWWIKEREGLLLAAGLRNSIRIR